jgi:myo-inositol 2-dehydrogenase/D-chiro-inositol 1-dehydrogenase
MIGIAVIGCGGMGSWHAMNVARQPGLRVTAVADVDTEAAQRTATSVGAAVVDQAEIVAAADVDAVVIASSDETHAEFATAAISLGKPCLLEKPIGATLVEAEQILDAEVAAGRLLTRVGFMRELDPAHAQVATALGDLGEVTKVRSVHRNVDAEPRPVELLFSQSIIHDIHTIRWLSGAEIQQVQVHVVSRSDGFRDVHMVCNLASGAVGVIEFEDRGFAYEVQVEVTAAGGMATSLPHPRALVRQGGSEALAVGADWFARFEDAYRLEVEEWAATLGDGVFRGPTVWDGYAAQVVADAAQRSIASGAPVQVVQREMPDLYR